MIKVRDLNKKYGDICAVKDISIDIEKGHVYGFLGANGAGKSTTLNIITGCIAATSGDVTVCGFDINKEAAAAKACIGYLPEQPPLYLDMTVYEYLDFVGEAKKIKKDERIKQIKAIMQQTMLTEVKDRLIKNLSKGFKQRVGIAQAILGYPAIIILDEPTVGLDPKQIMIIRDLILSLKQKHTVLLSSHIMQEISAVCDYIIVISEGTIVATGTPDELIGMYDGDTTVTLKTKISNNEAKELIRSVSGVAGVICEHKLSDYISFDIKLSGEKRIDEVCENLFCSFSEAGSKIAELKVNRLTLEDVFINLTTNNGIETHSAGEVAKDGSGL